VSRRLSSGARPGVRPATRREAVYKRGQGAMAAWASGNVLQAVDVKHKEGLARTSSHGDPSIHKDVVATHTHLFYGGAHSRGR
jgi:hypothetical protein